MGEVRPLQKTRTMAEMEQRFGKPIEELLSELYRREGGTRKVAQALGVSGTTVWYWMWRLGLPRRHWSLAAEEGEERG